MTALAIAVIAAGTFRPGLACHCGSSQNEIANHPQNTGFHDPAIRIAKEITSAVTFFMLVERRLKDFRRIATRYDRYAKNFLAALCVAAVVSYWL